MFNYTLFINIPSSEHKTSIVMKNVAIEISPRIKNSVLFKDLFKGFK